MVWNITVDAKRFRKSNSQGSRPKKTESPAKALAAYSARQKTAVATVLIQALWLVSGFSGFSGNVTWRNIRHIYVIAEKCVILLAATLPKPLWPNIGTLVLYSCLTCCRVFESHSKVSFYNIAKHFCPLRISNTDFTDRIFFFFGVKIQMRHFQVVFKHFIVHKKR